jgi:hypothetical protein
MFPSISTRLLLSFSGEESDHEIQSFSSPNQSSFQHTIDQIPGEDSDPSDMRLPLYLRCFATSICLLLLLIGIPGNALVPFVVLKTKDLRNSTNIFLINLSISDILVLIISTPTVLIELHSQPEVWFLGSFVCESLFPPLFLSLVQEFRSE